MESYKIAILAVAMLSSCTSASTDVTEFLQHITDAVGLDDRSPGEKMRLDAAAVWSREICSSQTLPFFRLDANDVSPTSLRAGEKVHHRIGYSMCPRVPNRSVRGRMITSIYYKARMVHTDEVAVEIKPGQWIVDADIIVPNAARPGAYTLRIDFSGAGIGFKDYVDFTVLP